MDKSLIKIRFKDKSLSASIKLGQIINTEEAAEFEEN